MPPRNAVPRHVILLVALLAAFPTHAAEGIRDLARVLDEMLLRARTADPAQNTPVTAPAPAPTPPTTRPTHPAIHGFLRFYQTRGAAHWSASLQRLAPLRSDFERIFREEGVPAELIWLGLVESGFRPDAESPKQAVGVWQFIPATAQRFGLRITPQSDERRDTMKATRAAARYLRFLHTRLGDWNLALAAYNAGEARVESAIRKADSRDFWTLADRGLLPAETRAYVPAVLAAQAMAADPAPAPLPVQSRTVFAPFTLSPGDPQ